MDARRPVAASGTSEKKKISGYRHSRFFSLLERRRQKICREIQRVAGSDRRGRGKISAVETSGLGFLIWRTVSAKKTRVSGNYPGAAVFFGSKRKFLEKIQIDFGVIIG
ncbi:hypothetical protein U1Q18_016625 [Sarracenia purpurea var. burkii]